MTASGEHDNNNKIVRKNPYRFFGDREGITKTCYELELLLIQDKTMIAFDTRLDDLTMTYRH